MKILLINPRTSEYTRSVTTPLGLLSIASTLQKAGRRVRIYDRTVEKINAGKVFEEFRPDIVGISLISYKSVTDTFEMCEFAKEQGCTVVVGGPIASELPEDVLSHRGVDLVSVGEGEGSWLDIAGAFENGGDYTGIKGIAYKKDGKVIFTGDREFLDLGTLAETDWSLIDVPRYFQRSYGCSKMLYLYSAKGCPNDCTFCYNKDFHRCTYRKRPVEALLKEIRFLVENYGMDGVYFADELWCRNRNEMKEMCDSLRSLNLDFVWGCQTRVGFWNREDFDYMYNSGCRWVFFGIESGSPAILEKMHKHIPFEKIVPTVNACKAAGIATVVSFIVGFPGETTEDLKQTVSLIEQFDTTMVNLNYYIIVPGSDMYRELIEQGRYSKPTLEYLEKHDQMEKIQHNFSAVPDRHMKAVRAAYMWRSFSSKDVSKDSKGSAFTVKVIIDALKGLTGNGLKGFVTGAVYSAVTFLKIFCNAHFNNKLLREYGIKK